jgi:hypothetical protein
LANGSILAMMRSTGLSGASAAGRSKSGFKTNLPSPFHELRQAKTIGMAGGGLPVRGHPRAAAAAPPFMPTVSIAAMNKRLGLDPHKVRGELSIKTSCPCRGGKSGWC